MKQEKKPNKLYLDIETTQIVGKAWGAYETNLTRIIRPSYNLSVAYQKNDGPIKVIALPDFPSFKKDHHDDKMLMGEIRELLDWADIVVAHNGDRFDVKKINTRLLMHGYARPSPYKTIDTLKICRTIFAFPINKLDYVCRELGIGRKIPHTGLDLWEECEENPKNKSAWRVMKKYNKHDVFLLRELEKRIISWAKTIPKITRSTVPCPDKKCGSWNTTKTMVRVRMNGGNPQKYQQRRCQACWHFFAAEIITKD